MDFFQIKSCPPWVTDDDKDALEALENEWASMFSATGESYMPTYCKRRALVMVFQSNKMESTLPQGISEQSTYELLDKLWDQAPEENFSVSRITWNTDGHHCSDTSGKQQTQQLEQHLGAFKFLRSQTRKALTLKTILKTHSILMANSVDGDGSLILAGVLRQGPVHAGSHVYPEAKYVESGLNKLLQSYNESSAEGLHPVAVAANLFYDLVTVHPFADGNGRLARLVVAHVLMEAGIPFPISLSSSHKKARTHYVRAIEHGRRDTSARNLSHLHALVAISISQAWINYKANKQWMNKVES